MMLEEITLALFAICNSIRIFAYLPQILKAATDKNGASAISGTTWSLFLVAHLSTIAHALVNLGDRWLAICFTGNALCCLIILLIAWWKGRSCAAPAHGARPTHRRDGGQDRVRDRCQVRTNILHPLSRTAATR